MSEPVQQMAALYPVSLETLIDAGVATPEQVAEYERLQAIRRARPRPRMTWARLGYLIRERRYRVTTWLHLHIFGCDGRGSW